MPVSTVAAVSTVSTVAAVAISVSISVVTPVALIVRDGIADKSGRNRGKGSALRGDDLNRTPLGVIHRGAAGAECQRAHSGEGE
jgi:hypothetical protein